MSEYSNSKVTIYGHRLEASLPILNFVRKNVTVISQRSTVVTHCILNASHFTDPERMVAFVRLESAASGSWTNATGALQVCSQLVTCSLITLNGFNEKTEDATNSPMTFMAYLCKDYILAFTTTKPYPKHPAVIMKTFSQLGSQLVKLSIKM